MKKTLLGLFLLSLSSVSIAAPINLIVNGSFEDTGNAGPADGQWAVYKSIPGWTTISGPGIEVRDNVSGTTEFGEHFVELDSHGAVDTNSTMEQIVQTSAGQKYELSFYYSPRVRQNSNTNGISVFWNNSLLADISATNTTNLNIWTLHQFIVFGTGGGNSLRFAATGLDDSLGGNIDNVSLSAVPVPAAAWLFGSAFGLFGLARKRFA